MDRVLSDLGRCKPQGLQGKGGAGDWACVPGEGGGGEGGGLRRSPAVGRRKELCVHRLRLPAQVWVWWQLQASIPNIGKSSESSGLTPVSLEAPLS